MSGIKAIMVVFAMCAALAACTTPQQRIENKENLLSASGFKVIPANTPARQSALLTLPPHQFIRETKNGQIRYAYADPTICGCLYVGDQAAFGAYRQNVFNQNIANEQLMAANDYAMASWDWGPWGGPWGGFYY